MSTRRDFIVRASQGLAAASFSPLVIGKRPLPRTAQGTGLVFEERYLDHVLPPRDGEPHPERPLRLQKIKEVFSARGLDSAMVPITPRPDSMPQIRGTHTLEHIQAVRRLEVSGPVAHLAVGGALAGVDAVSTGVVKNAFCAIRPPGHHANNTGAVEGFCYYSNAAIAARYAQATYGFGKVLILDFDYHHGNATQNAFYDDPSVLFFSAHDWEAYPGTGDPALTGEGDGTGLNINAHLDCGSKDVDMMRHWDGALSKAVESFRPDFVIVSAGFDSRKDDLLGCFDLSDDAFRLMTRLAMDYASDYCEGRLVSLLEGGYNVDGLALGAAAHAETLLEG